MRGISIAWVVVACVLAAWTGHVAADALRAPPTCPPWQQVRWRGSRHGRADCVPRPCTSHAACGGGRCVSHARCEVERERWVAGPGPCRDQDGDDVCDNRRRVVETVSVGECDAGGRCAEGRCVRDRECEAPLPPG